MSLLAAFRICPHGPHVQPDRAQHHHADRQCKPPRPRRMPLKQTVCNGICDDPAEHCAETQLAFGKHLLQNQPFARGESHHDEPCSPYPMSVTVAGDCCRQPYEREQQNRFHSGTLPVAYARPLGIVALEVSRFFLFVAARHKNPRRPAILANENNHVCQHSLTQRSSHA